jgi:putative membrane protein
MLAGMTPLAIAATVFATLAALIHVYIFVLESIRWTQEPTRRIFGVRSVEDAELMKPLAFNQGFYNLFLALGVLTGLVLLWTGGAPQAGYGVAIFGLLSMVLAAVVLVASNPKQLRSALIQGAAPLIGVVLLVLGAARSGA